MTDEIYTTATQWLTDNNAGIYKAVKKDKKCSLFVNDEEVVADVYEPLFRAVLMQFVVATVFNHAIWSATREDLHGQDWWDKLRVSAIRIAKSFGL